MCFLAGPLPHELYGKFTWKIDNFSDISKRELRSNVFEVGSYKWCATPPFGTLVGNAAHPQHAGICVYMNTHSFTD